MVITVYRYYLCHVGSYEKGLTDVRQDTSDHDTVFWNKILCAVKTKENTVPPVRNSMQRENVAIFSNNFVLLCWISTMCDNLHLKDAKWTKYEIVNHTDPMLRSSWRFRWAAAKTRKLKRSTLCIDYLHKISRKLEMFDCVTSIDVFAKFTPSISRFPLSTDHRYSIPTIP